MANDKWEDKKCPRCGGQLYAFESDGGALSRVSESFGVKVTVCNGCGSDEAYADPLGKKGFEGWAAPPRVASVLK